MAGKTYFAHLIVVLDKSMHHFDCKEIIVDRGFGVGEEDVRRNDGCEIMCVHLRSRLLINLMEGSYPVEECAKDFKTVSVRLR